jgi:hypothetical protein
MGGFPFVAFDVAASIPRIEGCQSRPSRIRCLLIGSCLTRPRSGKGLRDVARSIRRTVRVVEKLYVRRAPWNRFEVKYSTVVGAHQNLRPLRLHAEPGQDRAGAALGSRKYHW